MCVTVVGAAAPFRSIQVNVGIWRCSAIDLKIGVLSVGAEAL